MGDPPLGQRRFSACPEKSWLRLVLTQRGALVLQPSLLPCTTDKRDQAYLEVQRDASLSQLQFCSFFFVSVIFVPATLKRWRGLSESSHQLPNSELVTGCPSRCFSVPSVPKPLCDVAQTSCSTGFLVPLRTQPKVTEAFDKKKK